MKIPSKDIGHFKWRGMAFDPEGRRSASFKCDLCGADIKERDENLMAALQMHDTRKHGKQAKQAEASPSA